ncbi:MAG: glycosyltransferase [Ignavibacteria bacterium]|nr:glycosyltransferase [Ignavibacteria bacterium]
MKKFWKAMNDFLKNIISQTGNVIFFFKKKEIKREKINKILIISLYFRGDVLFNTVAIKMLKKIFPDAVIDVMVKSRSKEVPEGNPNINRLIVFDDIKTADYNDNPELKLKEKISLLKKIRKENYDLCIDFTGKYSTALIALIGGFRYSLGLNYNGFGFCYSKLVNINTQNTKGLLSEKYLNTLKEGLGINESEWLKLNTGFDNNCEIFLSPAEMSAAENKLNSLNLNPDKPLVCIQVTAGWKAKEWNEKNYSSLISELIYTDHEFVLIGSDDDKEINYKILDAVSPDLRKHFLSLPLKINAAIIKMLDLFIGSDSIGLHLAGAVGTPSIGLFGPTNPDFSNPNGDIHKVIYKKLTCSAGDSSQYCTRDAGKSCPDIECMRNISTGEVLENAEFLLNKYFNQKKLLLEKIKVLHISPDSVIHGTERHILSILKYSDREEFEHSVVNSKTEGIFGKDSRALYKLIKEGKFDIVHSHLNSYGGIIAKLAGAPAVVHTRHGVFWSEDELNKISFTEKYFQKLKSKMFDMTIALGEYEKKTLTEKFNYDEKKIASTINGVDIDDINAGVNKLKTKKELFGTDEDIIVGLVGRLEKQKGFDYLLDAVSLIKDKIDGIKFVIIGNGSLKDELIEKRNRLGLEDKILFIEYKKNILDYVYNFDMMDLTSLWEGLSYAVQEAMALSKPVIALTSPNVSGVKEIIVNGETGYLIESDYVNELGKYILVLSKDINRRLKFGRAAKERESEFFPEWRTASDMENVYRELYNTKFRNGKF